MGPLELENGKCLKTSLKRKRGEGGRGELPNVGTREVGGDAALAFRVLHCTQASAHLPAPLAGNMAGRMRVAGCGRCKDWRYGCGEIIKPGDMLNGTLLGAV